MYLFHKVMERYGQSCYSAPKLKHCIHLDCCACDVFYLITADLDAACCHRVNIKRSTATTNLASDKGFDSSLRRYHTV